MSGLEHSLPLGFTLGLPQILPQGLPQILPQVQPQAPPQPPPQPQGQPQEQPEAPALPVPKLEDIKSQSPLITLLKLLLAIGTAPYRRTFKRHTWAPLQQLRAARGDGKAVVPLVKDWKANKYSELQSVQVTATSCAGAVFSTMPWSRTEGVSWIVDALWFSSLTCSIFAIVTSVQTKSILDDLPKHEQMDSALPEIEVHRMQRTILQYKKSPGVKHWLMVFIWQFPSMTMAYGWCAYVGGLTVYICAPFLRGLPWDSRHKIAVIYFSVALACLLTYLVAMFFVYSGEKDSERSFASIQSSSLTVDTEAGIAASQNLSMQVETDSSTGRRESFNEKSSPVQLVREKMLRGFSYAESQTSQGPDRHLLY